MLNKHTKVIVFDLDGTLYEDTHHFDYYAKKLQVKLPTEKRTSFWKDYQLAIYGEHAVKIGRVYDLVQHLVLVQEKNIIIEAYNWEGNPLSASEVLALYPGPIEIDQVKMLSIGDLWWLPAAIAMHHGLSKDDNTKAFLETRSYMMKPEFVMAEVKGFKEALFGLKEKGFKLALLTNSPQKDSEVILSKLGFEALFDQKIFEGEKPTHTAQRFKELREYFQVEYHEIVSIGDNWINEIMPVIELGCSTIFINSHDIKQKLYADNVVKNIAELIPLLI